MNMFTAAFRAFDLVLFVFCKAEDQFEGLLAIFAIEFVTRHNEPPFNRQRADLRIGCTPGK
jgi:hypothetical protein